MQFHIKTLIADVESYIGNLSLYMTGPDEAALRQCMTQIKAHNRLCASVIAELLSKSPLPQYQVSHFEPVSASWTCWNPFVDEKSFTDLQTIDIAQIYRVDVIDLKRATIYNDCVNWCRRKTLKSVSSPLPITCSAVSA